jgi:hypothetical protein
MDEEGLGDFRLLVREEGLLVFLRESDGVGEEESSRAWQKTANVFGRAGKWCRSESRSIRGIVFSIPFRLS